jgi:Acetyltransferases
MIRLATDEDLNCIANLHIECFPNYFLTKLGTDLLAKYYKEFITDKDIFIVYEEKGQINGLLVGTPDSNMGRHAFIRHNFISLGKRVIWLCIRFDKDTIKRINLLNALRTKKKINVGTECSEIRLLSICVSNQSRGNGIAEELIDVFEKRLIKAGFNSYGLTVYKDNQRANRFYQKAGMQMERETETEYKYKKACK